MPDYTQYPLMADVRNLLMSSAFWPTDANKQVLAEEQASIGALAVGAEWERRTGWTPFLADAAASTWYWDYTDPYGELSFDGGFVSVSSVTINGTAQTLNTQYVLEPRNAGNIGRPYTHLNMRYGYSTMTYPSTANAIAVTGRRGFCTTLPADVWQTLQDAAALIALTSVENLQSIASIGMDGFNKSFDVVGIVTQKDLLTTWSKNFDIRVQQYQRVVA